MRIIICGSRTFTNKALLFRTMDKLTRKLRSVTVISGGARGADKLAEQWAFERKQVIEIFHPDWSKGRLAGILRNIEMVKANPKVLVAFHDGASLRTSHIITIASKAGIKVKVILFKGKA